MHDPEEKIFATFRDTDWRHRHSAAGKATPQSNGVDVDERGLVYLADRYSGFDILELNCA